MRGNIVPLGGFKGGGNFVPSALLALTLGCAPVDEVPTYEVTPQVFRHDVTAEGTLKASKVTGLAVSMEVHRVRLVWLAAEGRVEEGDIVARFDREDMLQRLEESRLDRAAADLRADRAKLENAGKVAGFDTDLQLADLELDHARRFQKIDESAFSRREIIESAIDEKLADKHRSHMAVTLQAEEARGTTDLELVLIRGRQAQQEIDRAERSLSAVEVRAPHAGLFIVARDRRGNPLEAGGEMQRGQKIGEIPDLAVLEAEVFVLEADAGGLEIGKTATVVLEAYPERAHPARISRVDAIAKPRFRGSPVQYFGVTLQFDNQEDLSMKPGQRVRATLVLEQLEEALVVPRQAVFNEDNQHHVYAENGGDFERRPVEISAKSNGLMVISVGVAVGERVALRRPATSGESQSTKETEIADKP